MDKYVKYERQCIVYNNERRRKLLLYFLYRKRQKEVKKRRRWWVHPLFTVENRILFGAEYLISEMRLTDTDKFVNYLRMSAEIFDQLLLIVGPQITKLVCIREPISASSRLALTLR